MKNNIVKYIFIIVVICLIGFAIYTIYQDKANENVGQEVVSVKEETKQTDIRLAISELDTINPILSKNKNVQDISFLIYDSLFRITPDYQIENCLAEECSKSGENSYLVKLKKNVKWHDGTTFTTKDLKFTIDRLKEIDSIYAYNVQYVIGLEIIDDYTIRINLDKEIPFFEYYLTFPILSDHYYADEDFKETEKNKHPIGTGMFVIAENNDATITLKKNQNWWNKDNKNIVLDKITIHLYSSMGEVYNAFKTGNIDLIHTTMNIEEYIGTIGYQKKENKGRQHDFIALNFNNELLQRGEIRKAISYSIDKSNIVSAVYNNQYTTANFPLDYGSYLYEDKGTSSGYNVDKAKAILEENGWVYQNKVWQKKENYRTKRLEFNFVVKASDEDRVAVAEIVEEQLENLGLKINLIKANDTQYERYLENKNYDLILARSTVGLSPDLTSYFGEGNLANYGNEEALSILKDVSNIKETDKLKEKYARLSEIYQSDFPYISLYFDQSITVYSNSLHGELGSNWYNSFYHIETWYRQ